ncbi:hypothetical protein IFM89_004634 [Coptis chinensis]|uniref:Uncharacterized protein n=1 Tax=Coptis chinensis TaxID=261450 RepID=A0A835LEE5_9MAGN|nr:hypothetical protein IFM89_004634 [Coptis chinensis]
MFSFLRRALKPHYCNRFTELKTCTFHDMGFLRYLQNHHLTSFSTTPSSKTVDYLVHSCGLSLKTAQTLDKKINLTTTEKPDLVLSVLRSYEMSNAQVAEIVSRVPSILKCDPDKTLKPKTDFLHGLGFSGPEIAKILICDRSFLRRNLERRIIPGSNFLKKFISNHDHLFRALKNRISQFDKNLDGVMGNITTLRDYGAQECSIVWILVCQPRALVVKNDRLKETVEAVIKMGFVPSSGMFRYAVRAKAGVCESGWEAKWQGYRKLGFSDEEIVSVFRKDPYCLMSSVEKIRKGVEFFTRKLRWKLGDIL